MVVDAAGNMYLSGSYRTQATVGTTTLTAKGGQGAYGYFVAKRGTSGKYLWVKSLDGAANALALGGKGSLYLAGSYEQAAAFGNKTLPAPKSESLWVARMDAAAGTFTWVATAGEGSGVTYGMGVAADASGNVYATGSTTAGPTFGATTLQKSKVLRLWVARLTPAGAFSWVVASGEEGKFQSEGLALDSAGALRVVGDGVATLSPCAKTKGASVLKLSDKGACLWSASLGASSSQATAVGVDSAGNAYFSGHFKGSAAFGATTLYSSPSAYSAFLARVDANGAFAWAHAMGGSGSDFGSDVSVLGSGELAATGMFRHTGTFAGTTLTAQKGKADNWVARFTAAGKLRWITTANSQYVADERASVVALAPAGVVRLAGRFSSSQTIGSFKVTAAGSYDIFLARIGSTP